MIEQNAAVYQHIYRQNKKNRIRYWFFILVFVNLCLLFLPWTQNIRATGMVSTLRQEDRPQQVNTIIGGRVDKWFVKEGDYVQQGDTIVQLSEIKEEYLDPALIQRTGEQIEAKQSSVGYYQNKIGATESQIGALQNALAAKLNQLRNKLKQTEVKILSDSMDMIAARNDWNISTLQYNRQKVLHDSGLVSLTQLESRNQSYQTSFAKKVSAENKYFASKV